MTVLYPNLCYNKVCYKETALYVRTLQILCGNTILLVHYQEHQFSAGDVFKNCYNQVKTDKGRLSHNHLKSASKSLIQE